MQEGALGDTRSRDGEARGNGDFHSGRDVANGEQMDALDELLVQDRCFASLKSASVVPASRFCGTGYRRKATLANARFQTVENRMYRHGEGQCRFDAAGLVVAEASNRRDLGETTYDVDLRRCGHERDGFYSVCEYGVRHRLVDGINRGLCGGG